MPEKHLLPFYWLPQSLWLYQIISVAQSCPTLCNPMNRSTPGLPVHHQLPEFTQTHFYRVSDAIQPSHPLSSPSPLAPNPSQHQSLFQLFAWGGQSTGVSALASFLPKKSQGWSPSEWTGWISLQSKGLSREIYNPAIILLLIYPREVSTSVQIGSCTRMSIAALFMITPNWKLTQMFSSWLMFKQTVVLHIHTIEYSSAVKGTNYRCVQQLRWISRQLQWVKKASPKSIHTI